MVFSSRDFSRRRIGAAAALVLAGAALAGCGGGSSADPDRGKDAKSFSLTITRNAIEGGKNTEEAEWITRTVIPKFVAAQKAKGVTAKVTFRGQGVDDEAYKTKLALDLKSRSGADIMDIDGIWVGEFAQAGYLLPLKKAVGAPADAWDGWSKIPGSVQRLAMFDGERYGVPPATDGRVIFFNKELFGQAGLPADWQPKSWQDVLAAGRALKRLPGVTPIQLNAGTAMGEATSMQGALPLLAGAGAEIYADGKWTGGGEALKQVLGLYAQVYGREGLGDPKLQQEAKGRDKSFEEFAAGKIGILFEGDYFWRDVLNPKTGVAKMKTRDQDVGYALIPALSPGRGLRGQSFVSMSGGAVTVLNPNTKYPQQAFELLAFMNSPEMVKARTAGTPEITSRTDVNKEILAGDPFLTFVSEKVLPVTSYRPGLSAYPQVSTALQEATASVVSGKSPDQAAAEYTKKLEGIVGGAAHVTPR
ncbi:MULTISPECIES: extracellular solute-binding protein [unclassified Actinomadura]|uniref:extracellular solute-binding protein n=1 Tax=unclassified Actinomadura TaxID=2626254 RepID=UPI0011EDA23A|nr:extracellular solute-binding protein [Actinomadura sp. K4S16]